MTVVSSPSLRGTTVDPREFVESELSLPPWVWSCVGHADPRIASGTENLTIEVATGKRHSLVTARVHGVQTVGPLDLQRRTAEAYRRIATILRELPAREPIRLWNFVPGIGDTLGDMPRYMVFNAGRFAAYHDWFGGVDAFDRMVPTATGIGHPAEDLVIHVLAAGQPGVHIMNTRQRAPRCYSPCYGAFPPCFARATLTDGAGGVGWNVLIGGTAAIRGERSVAHGDARGQTVETFRNLEQLLRVAESTAKPESESTAVHSADIWRSFRSLRVYLRRAADEPVIRTMVTRRFPHLPDIEFLGAEICRPELLLEIEGTAAVSLGASG